jgi:ribosomal protein S17E
MGYFPKSKASVLKTTGLEFIKVSNNEPYEGSYIEFSDGTFYTGNDPARLGEQLIKRVALSSNFESGDSNNQYRRLKKEIHGNLAKITTIPPFKTKPVPNDIDRGYFTRYFCKRANEKVNYFEISEQTYNLLLNRDPKYDYNLYIIGSIEWALKEINSISQEEINQNTLNIKQSEFPFLNLLFNNLSEYKPLYTDGTEFTTKSGKRQIPYVGFYHLHPNFGFAMVGAYHIPGKHKRLFPPEEEAIGRVSETQDQPVRETTRVNIPTSTQTSTSTPRTTTSRPSYGGGSGY